MIIFRVKEIRLENECMEILAIGVQRSLERVR